VLVFAWQKAQRIDVVVSKKGDKKYYAIQGPLFFASTTCFQKLFDFKNDPKQVIVDFKDSRVCDHSALEAINTLTDRYKKQGKKITLVHLSADCRQLLKDAGNMIVVNIDDPEYTVSTH